MTTLKTPSLVVLSMLTTLGAFGCSASFDAKGEGKGSLSFASGEPIQGAYAPLAIAAPPAYETHCSPAPSLVKTAVCVCKDLDVTGSLKTHARGPELPADVGVGGDVSLVSGSEIDGSLRVDGKLDAVGDLGVAHHVWAAGGVQSVGTLDVGGDLASGSDLDGVGDLVVRGQLRVAGDDSWVGSREVSGGRAGYEAPSVSDACGCDAASIYDVSKAVATARDHNDNQSLGKSLEGVGTTSISLPSGRYYVGRMTSVGDLSIRVEGDVQLYIDGDLDSVGTNNIEIGEHGTLDLFVGGTLSSVGEVRLGDPNRPEAFRLYVGGASSRISLVGGTSWSGVIYAPTSSIQLVGETEIHGAIVAGSIHKTGDLVVKGASAGSAGELCETTPIAERTPATPSPRAPSGPN